MDQEQAVPTVAAISPRRGAAGQRLSCPDRAGLERGTDLCARQGYLKDWYFDFGAHV